MLRVWKTSGEVVVILNEKEFRRVLREFDDSFPTRSLKQHIHKLTGHPRFTQRLLREHEVLSDCAELTCPEDLQLVILPYTDPDQAQSQQIRQALALDEGVVEELEQLLSTPFNPNAPLHKSDARERETTALVLASFYGRTDVVSLLLEAAADPNLADAFGSVPINRARCFPVVHLLAEEGADINRGDGPNCVTPLHNACHYGDAETALYLLEKAADPSMVTAELETPLHQACRKGIQEVVSALLFLGVDINAQDNQGERPLHAANRSGDIEICHCLILHGANPDAKDHNGRIPSTMASLKGHHELYLWNKNVYSGPREDRWRTWLENERQYYDCTWWNGHPSWKQRLWSAGSWNKARAIAEAQRGRLRRQEKAAMLATVGGEGTTSSSLAWMPLEDLIEEFDLKGFWAKNSKSGEGYSGEH